MTNRNWGLDLVRAVAALSVVFSHFLQHTTDDRYLEWLNSLFGGLYGVELFFVLSGFLIGGILIREFDAGRFGPRAMLNFWQRRWMRTLPAYYAFLLVYIWIAPASQNANLVQYAFFIQNFAWQTHPGFFGVSWSLTIEEIFYLVVPFFFLFAMAFKVRNQYKIAIALAGYLAFSIAAKIITMDLLTLEHVDARKFAVLRLDAIWFGLIFAYLQKYHASLFEGIARLGVTAIVPYLVFRAFASTSPIFNSELGNVIKFTLAPLTLSMLIPWTFNMRAFDHAVSRFITFTSKISYSLYLCHIIVIMLANQFLLAPGPKHILALVVYTVGSYGFAWLSYILVERSFLRLRDKKPLFTARSAKGDTLS